MMTLRTLLFVLALSRVISDVDGLRMGKMRSTLTDELQRILKNTKDKLNTVNKDVMCIKKAIACVNQQRVSPKDCADLYKQGFKQSDVYTIQPKDGLGKMKVYCDMVTEGGGWTVFQRRQDGSVNFFRGWNDYKNGFGTLSGEFWLGNDNLHRLTRQDSYKLRVDLEDYSNNKKYAVYSSFSVGSEKDKYKLSIGPYSGNAGDSLSYHNGRPFTTKDRDNDSYSGNCAVSHTGAWWYGGCVQSNLNGQFGNNKASKGVFWFHFKGNSLKRASMMFRPVGFKSGK